MSIDIDDAALPGGKTLFLRETLYQATAHLAAGRVEEAIVACETVLKTEAGCAEAFLVLGLISFELDEPSHALPLLKRAHELQPDICDFTQALAAAYARVGNVNEGLFYAKLATTQPPHPTYPDLLPAEFRNFLTNLEESKPHLYRHRAERFLIERRPNDAIEACQKQLNISPGDPATLRLLARASRAAGQVERAIAAGHALLHGHDQTPEDLSEVAAALTTAGRFDEAQACHNAVLSMAPQDAKLGSRRLQDLIRSANASSVDVARAHAEWRHDHAAPLTGKASLARPVAPSASADKTDRRLRVGYFCGQFHDNDLTRLLTPILDVHDRSRIEIYCYSDGKQSDLISERINHLSDRWTDLVDVDDETAAEILRGDAIDVAVDLTGHGDGCRLLTLARSTVPATANWLGYDHPVGNDYFLATPASWPDPEVPPTCGGRVHHLSGPLACYAPPAILPEVNTLPASALGYVSFGIVADLAAIDTNVAATLRPLLLSIPNARLIINNRHELDETCVLRTYEAFSHLGLRDRIDIVNPAENFSNEFEFYHHVDIALDVAHRGCITETCRALWMGVPVLTVPRDNFAGRLTAATLIDAECREWVCQDAADLAHTGRLIALDLSTLADTRETLRGRVSASPLADVRATARSLESAFQQIWTQRHVQ